jgi:hypothetical protein
MLSLSNTRKAVKLEVTTGNTPPDVLSSQLKDLRYQLLLRQGSSTIIIGKPKTK